MVKSTRVSKAQYYLGIAEAVSERSPCLKAKIGVIIVKGDTIVSTGYNGPARGIQHCTICKRLDKPSGSPYIDCPAVHAEENAIINAARYGVTILDGDMYIYGKSREACYRCKRAIRNAGIRGVIYEQS